MRSAGYDSLPGDFATTGEHEGWRWTMIGETVALDNRPMVDAVPKPGTPPLYQSVVVPKAVLERATARKRFVGCDLLGDEAGDAERHDEPHRQVGDDEPEQHRAPAHAVAA